MKSLIGKIAVGRKVIGVICLVSLFSAVSFGQKADTKNLLKTVCGGAGSTEEVNIENNAGENVVLDQKEAKTISFSAESKAENVTGEADVFYSIYLNITYADGTKTDGVNCLFKTGTHDWEKSEGTFTPDKPIKLLDYNLLFRGRKGKAWFRNAVLIEGKFPAVEKK